MNRIAYFWTDDQRTREFALVRVAGTTDAPYGFGAGMAQAAIHLRDFFIGVVPVTQALWHHVMGLNPAVRQHPDLPVENVSWVQITQPGGFLEKLNDSTAAASLREQAGGAFEFRLPSETEWEYAARGGPAWRDGFRYSGSNDIATVAWYDRRHGDHTQPVATKAPNQLGLYDMAGNVWEWCHDTFTHDVRAIPVDGSPYSGPGEDRVLRGGCFHNWAEHCTVFKRYEIDRRAHDGCIGVRVVLAEHGALTTGASEVPRRAPRR